MASKTPPQHRKYLRYFTTFWLRELWKPADENGTEEFVELLATVACDSTAQWPDDGKLEETLQPEKYLQTLTNHESSMYKVINCIHPQTEMIGRQCTLSPRFARLYYLSKIWRLYHTHRLKVSVIRGKFNPLMGTLKPQSKGPLYSNMVIGTLAVDGWAVIFGTSIRGLGPLIAVPKVRGVYSI